MILMAADTTGFGSPSRCRRRQFGVINVRSNALPNQRKYLSILLSRCSLPQAKAGKCVPWKPQLAKLVDESLGSLVALLQQFRRRLFFKRKPVEPVKERFQLIPVPRKVDAVRSAAVRRLGHKVAGDALAPLRPGSLHLRVDVVACPDDLTHKRLKVCSADERHLALERRTVRPRNVLPDGGVEAVDFADALRRLGRAAAVVDPFELVQLRLVEALVAAPHHLTAEVDGCGAGRCLSEDCEDGCVAYRGRKSRRTKEGYRPYYLVILCLGVELLGSQHSLVE